MNNAVDRNGTSNSSSNNSYSVKPTDTMVDVYSLPPKAEISNGCLCCVYRSTHNYRSKQYK